MESGHISDEQITASSFYGRDGLELEAWKGRLNNGDYWATASDKPRDPWIQLDLLSRIVVAGVITQGSAHDRYDEWVTDLRIQYADLEDTLIYILENNQPQVSKLFVNVSNMVYPFT